MKGGKELSTFFARGLFLLLKKEGEGIVVCDDKGKKWAIFRDGSTISIAEIEQSFDEGTRLGVTEEVKE